MYIADINIQANNVAIILATRVVYIDGNLMQGLGQSKIAALVYFLNYIIRKYIKADYVYNI
jgi:hypothetical protein